MVLSIRRLHTLAQSSITLQTNCNHVVDCFKSAGNMLKKIIPSGRINGGVVYHNKWRNTIVYSALLLSFNFQVNLHSSSQVNLYQPGA